MQGPPWQALSVRALLSWARPSRVLSKRELPVRALPPRLLLVRTLPVVVVVRPRVTSVAVLRRLARTALCRALVWW